MPSSNCEIILPTSDNRHFRLTVFSEHCASSACDFGPQISALLRNWAADGRSFKFPLHVDNDARVILKVDVRAAVDAPPRAALSHDNRRHDFFSELWLSFLDCGHDHVPHGCPRHFIQPTFDSFDGDDVKVLRTSVVCAVHDGSDAETERGSELVPHRSSSSCVVVVG